MVCCSVLTGSRPWWVLGVFIGVVSAPLSAQDYGPPDGYYDGVEGLTGNALRVELQDIISTSVLSVSYSQMDEAFAVLDRDPENENNIILLYSGDSTPHSGFPNVWNREHVWPRSFGAGSGPAFSDAHHLFPADADTNSDRLNYAFDDLQSAASLRDAPESKVNDAERLVEPRDEDKGRIARALLYMETRYDETNPTDDFTLSDIPLSSAERMGKLTTLLRWNRLFPPDDYERRRNDLIHDGFRAGNNAIIQGNRNPYIDYPELADVIFYEDEMTWNAWRFLHYSLADLRSGVSMDTFDEDGDGLNNLAEYFLQGDPTVADKSVLPSVDRVSEELRYVNFRKATGASISLVDAILEVSSTPLEENSWTEIPFTDRDLLQSSEGNYNAASFPHTATYKRTPFFRFRIIRQTTPEDTFESIIDPAKVLTSGPAHLFTYTLESKAAPGWRVSDWIGHIFTEEAPWFYNEDHRWIFSTSDSEEKIWLYDPSLGWLYTSFQAYPALYVMNTLNWYIFSGILQTGERQFLDLSTNATLSENDLIQDNP